MDVGTLIRTALAFALLPPGTAAVAQSCQLCAASPSAPQAPQRPLVVNVDAALDFSTAVYTSRGTGTITIDARTGRQRLNGLAALGGPGLVGTVTITGEPLARVVITMPRTILLTSNLGTTADVSEIRADLPGNPAIGSDGRLVFTFGGKLTVRDGADGEFRGRIPVTVDYQ